MDNKITIYAKIQQSFNTIDGPGGYRVLNLKININGQQIYTNHGSSCFSQHNNELTSTDIMTSTDKY